MKRSTNIPFLKWVWDLISFLLSRTVESSCRSEEGSIAASFGCVTVLGGVTIMGTHYSLSCFPFSPPQRSLSNITAHVMALHHRLVHWCTLQALRLNNQSDSGHSVVGCRIPSQSTFHVGGVLRALPGFLDCPVYTFCRSYDTG